VIERFFGSLKTMFFSGLSGNTVVSEGEDSREARLQAKGSAVWTLERLYELLNEFLFCVYDQRLHPALGTSPATAYIRRTAVGGRRPTRTIAYDENFRIQTLPLTPRGTAKIQSDQGVKVNRVYYWCAEMRDRTLHGTRVAVRYDPFNIAVAYVYLNNRWTRCTSRYASDLQGHTETEMKLASAQILRRGVEIGRGRELDTKVLAEFFRSLEGEERSRRDNLRRLAEQRLRGAVPGETEEHDTVDEDAAGSVVLPEAGSCTVQKPMSSPPEVERQGAQCAPAATSSPSNRWPAPALPIRTACAPDYEI